MRARWPPAPASSVPVPDVLSFATRTHTHTVVEGADGTPYANGRFKLQISMPPRYPFEPPKVHYVTPIYHPNIDSAGRICLDILNMPPKGAWKPSLNISTVLQSLRLLMSEPNPDDGLMVDITHQYIHNHASFERTAAEHTRRHAMRSEGGQSGGGIESSTAANAGATSTAGVADGTSAPAAADPSAGASSLVSTEDTQGRGSSSTRPRDESAASEDDAKRPRV